MYYKTVVYCLISVKFAYNPTLCEVCGVSGKWTLNLYVGMYNVYYYIVIVNTMFM